MAGGDPTLEPCMQPQSLSLLHLMQQLPSSGLCQNGHDISLFFSRFCQILRYALPIPKATRKNQTDCGPNNVAVKHLPQDGQLLLDQSTTRTLARWELRKGMLVDPLPPFKLMCRQWVKAAFVLHLMLNCDSLPMRYSLSHLPLP